MDPITMRIFKLFLLILPVVLIIGVIEFPIHASEPNTVNTFLDKLNSNEKSWLETHPSIRIGIMDAWAPFAYQKGGEPIGIDAEFIRLFNTRLTAKIKIVSGAFKKNQELVKSGEIDAIMDITPTKKRLEYFRFTKPYLTIPHVIVASKNGDYYENEAALNGKTIALEKNFWNNEHFKKNYPQIKIINFDNTALCLDAIARGEVDAYAGNRAASIYLIEQGLLSNLKTHGRIQTIGSVLTIGVARNNPILVSILDKVLLDISNKELHQVLNYWVGDQQITQVTSDLNLTTKEQTWLLNHPTIRVHNESGWAPYNFFENGKPKGFSIDYIRLLTKKLGIKVQFITGPTWGEFIEQIKEKKLDVMLNIAKTPEREKFINFSNGYFDLALALFIRDDMQPIHSIKELYGKRFAIPKGFYFEETLRKHPRVQLIGVKDTAESIQAVAFNRADALQDLIPVVRYYQRKLSIDNIKLGGTLDLNEGNPIPLNIGVRKDWPLLASIFNKGMQAISDEELTKIQNKWLYITEVKKQNKKVKLSLEENQWLSSNPEIKIAVDPGWKPLEWINPETKTHEGIIADYLHLITERSGLKFKIIPAPTWSKAMENVKQNRADAFSGVKKTVERQKYLNYSNAYMDLKDAIITRKDHKAIRGVSDLMGEKVGVVKSYWTEEILRKEYPKLNIVSVNNSLEGLKFVSSGKLDAFVDDNLVTGYLISQNSLYSLKYAALDLDPNKNMNRGIHIAVRKDVSPFILFIINKAIASINIKDRNKILGQWGVVAEEESKTNNLNEPIPQTSETKSIEVATREIVIQGLLFILIVLVLIGISYFLLQRYFSNLFTNWLESNKFTWIASILMGFFLIMISIIAIVALNKIEQQTRKSVANALQGLVSTTHESLTVWLEHHKASIQRLADDPNLRMLTQEHLLVTRSKKHLLKSITLEKIRNYFTANRVLHKDIGFFVIAPDYINIGSMRDTNIGFVNLIAQRRPEFIKRAFNGETVFVPPLLSDVKLEKGPGAALSPPTMFFITPIKNMHGDIIAAMTLRLNPKQEFTRLIQAGNNIGTGETYAFDKQGVLLSNSRNEYQLQKMGRLTANTSAMLNLKLADPGDNLLAGEVPNTSLDEAPLTYMAKSATSGKSGMNIKGYRDHRGVTVLGSWIWDKNLGFGLATEIDAQEALDSFYTTRIIFGTVMGITFVLMILLTAISLWLGKRTNKILVNSQKELEERVVDRTSKLTHEVQEHQKSQAALQKNETKFRNLVEGFKENYFFFSQNTTGAIHYITPSVNEILGYTQDEMFEDFRKFISGHEINKKAVAHFESSLKGIIQPSFEIQVIHKDGSFRWLDISEVPTTDNSGKVIGVEGIAHDITERKKAAEDIQKNMDALESFQKVAVDRELKMIKLKEEVNNYLSEKNQPQKYTIVS